MTTFWTGLVLLVLIVAGSTVLIVSAHVPWVRALTGAAPLEPEPVQQPAICTATTLPLTADRTYCAVQAARRTRTTATKGTTHA